MAASSRARFARSLASRFADPAVLLAFVMVAIFGLQTWTTGRTAPEADFYQFWAVGRLTAANDDIYSPDARRAMGAVLQLDARTAGASPREAEAASVWPATQTTGTPTLYAVFGFLQTGNFEFDSGLFELLSLAALLAAVFWLCSRLGFPLAASLLLGAILLATSEPLWMDVRWGQLNALQVGILVGYLALRSGSTTVRRDMWAGALLGAAILLKPNLALIVVLLGVELVLARRWRDLAAQAAGLAVGGLLGLGVATVRFGSIAPWFGWGATFLDLVYRQGYAIAPGNAALARLVREQTGFDPGALLMVGLVALTVGVLLRARFISPGETTSIQTGVDAASEAAEERRWAVEVLLVGVAVAITLLGSPITWHHYYLLLTPLAIFLVRPAMDRFGGSGHPLVRQGAAAVSLLLLSAKPVQALWPELDAVAYLWAFVGATVLLLGAALWELSSDRQVEVPVASSST